MADNLIDSLVSDLDRLLGKDTVAKTFEQIDSEIKYYTSSGCYPLDKIMSGKGANGGFPGGRLVEIFGSESSGKTALLCHAIAEAQAKGGFGIFIDRESAFDISFARNLGIKFEKNKFLYVRAKRVSNIERVLEVIRRAVRVDYKVPCIIGLDSVAACPSEVELETGLKQVEDGKAQPGTVANRISRYLRSEILESIAGGMTTLIFTNQVRNQLSRFSAPEDSPGGHALKHHASIRLELRQDGKLVSLGEHKQKFPKGIHFKATTVKNKIARPYLSCPIEFNFDTGIDNEASVFDYLEDQKMLNKDKSTGRYGWASRKLYRFEIIKIWKEDIKAFQEAKDMVDVCFIWEQE